MSSRRARRASEDGMTLTELIVAVVITGIVMLPIAMAVNFSLQAPAQTTSRSASATTRSIAVDLWSRDVGSASLIYLWNTPGLHLSDPTSASQLWATTSGQVTALPSVACPSGATPPATEVAQFVWTDTTRSSAAPSVVTGVSADYQLKFTRYRTTPEAMKVDLTRTLKGDANAPPVGYSTSVVLSGYCVPGETVLKDFYEDTGQDGATAWYGSRRVRAYFSLRDSVDETPHVVNLEAAARASCINSHPKGGTAPDVQVPLGAC